MREVTISEFKAKCLALLEEVEKTREPIRVTKFGKPVAEVVPPRLDETRKWIGSLKSKLTVTGDIIGPVFDESDWKD